MDAIAGWTVGQQFTPAIGDALRARLPGATVCDRPAGPAGWSAELDVLLAGPTNSWRGTPRPAGWPGRLRWVQLPSAGVDGYPEWLLEVPWVTSAPALNAGPIAEFAMAAMLAHEKRLPECWIHDAAAWRPHSLGTLHGKTLGLAGLGAIGSALARHGLAFGMTVLGLRRSLGRPMEGVHLVADRRELAARADHLVLCLPATPETRHFVDAEFLAHCKPGLHLVNVARGDLVDQNALLQALDAGTLTAASLDATTPEPLPAGHPLYEHPRVRLSPHVAWSSPLALPRLIDLFARQLGLLTAGLPLQHRLSHQPTAPAATKTP